VYRTYLHNIDTVGTAMKLRHLGGGEGGGFEGSQAILTQKYRVADPVRFQPNLDPENQNLKNRIQILLALTGTVPTYQELI
jgi:hypothetical protein